MENPATWGEAERIVQEVLREDTEQQASGEFRVGRSLAGRITGALRAHGLLVDDTEVT